MWNEETRKALGAALRAASQSSGTTQQQLSERLNIDRGTVSRVWRGLMKKPTHYQNMAQALDVDLSTLLPEAQDPIITQTPLPPSPPSQPAMPALPRKEGKQDAYVLVIASEKGGVGKTTTAVSLASVLAELEYRVLLLDLDTQGNATTHLNQAPSGLNLLHALEKTHQLEPVATDWGLDLISGGRALASATSVCMQATVPSRCLVRALRPLLRSYDFILIDTPPSLGIVSINALMAASHVVIPVQLEVGALEGLAQIHQTIEEIREHNETLEILGTIPSMHDARTNLSREALAVVKNAVHVNPVQTIIHRNVAMAEAWAAREPINHYDPSSRGAREYESLVAELLERLHHGQA